MLASWLERLPPAVTLTNYVIMYRESCWCSKTVWLCNFCTFAIRNIKDLFSYFKPDSPLHSAAFPGVTLASWPDTVLYQHSVHPGGSCGQGRPRMIWDYAVLFWAGVSPSPSL